MALPNHVEPDNRPRRHGTGFIFAVAGIPMICLTAIIIALILSPGAPPAPAAKPSVAVVLKPLAPITTTTVRHQPTHQLPVPPPTKIDTEPLKKNAETTTSPVGHIGREPSTNMGSRAGKRTGKRTGKRSGKHTKGSTARKDPKGLGANWGGGLLDGD